MPEVISTNGQTLRKNCYASSSEAKLTLRVNGEEDAVVITPQLGVVPAGFDAPTVAPVASSGGAGNVPEGYYVYRYAYASSRYPFVANDVTAGGEEWPRSSQSPSSNTFQVTGGTKQVSVQVTYSTRSDVDYIFIYRTVVQTTSALAEAVDDAGDLFYVGRLANNTAGGTGTFTDNSVTDTGEAIELDNYVCPLFWRTVFDGYYWWGFGNITLEVVVTLDGTDTFSIDTAQSDVDAWYAGRDGYTINFVGITTGGYDGRGNYYFEATTATTGQAFASSDLVTPATLGATGTTTAYLTAPATTLYRSKGLNPFSWGRTTVLNDGTKVPELWAERIGGGTGTAIGLIPNERILILNTEGPQKSYALDLNAADNTDFLGTLRTLDEAQSTGSHFSQFPMRDQNAQTTLASVNAKAYQILSADGQSQIPIGDPVIETLKLMKTEDETPHFFHGVFDYRTELNCWWVKTTDAELTIDTLIYQHSNTGKWGMKYAPGITASATVYDAVTQKYHTFVGDQWGKFGIGFRQDRYFDWVPVEPEYEVDFGIGGQPGTGTMTVPVLYSVISATAADGTMTVQWTPNTDRLIELGDVVFIYLTDAPISGNYVVESIPTEGEFTVSATGTFTSSQGYITDIFDTVPIAFYQPTSGYIGICYRFPVGTVLLNAGNLDLSTTSAEYFNVLTGTEDSETGEGTHDAYIGATPCVFYRYFNGGNPQQNKRTLEWHISQENVGGVNYFRLYPDYQTTTPSGQVDIFNKTLTQDTQSVTATGSIDWFTTNTPASVYHAFGTQMLDIGFDAYKALDFTIMLQPS